MKFQSEVLSGIKSYKNWIAASVSEFFNRIGGKRSFAVGIQSCLIWMVSRHLNRMQTNCNCGQVA